MTPFISAQRPRNGWMVFFLFNCLMAGATLAADSAETSETLAPIKDHTLFVGLKCRITQDGKVYSVRDVVKSKVMLESDDTVTSVPINDLQGLDVRPDTTVASARMKIDGLRHERAYSVLANPAIEAERAQQAMAEAASVRMDIALAATRQWDAVGGQAGISGGAAPATNTAGEISTTGPFDSNNWPSAGALAAAAQHLMIAAANDMTINPARHISSFQDMETEQDQHDVLLIEFEASASETIPDAYAISLTEYTTPDNPKEPAIAMHFSDLPWIGTRPRHFTIRQINFPRGFKVNDVQVHIFSRGKEIASNLSEKSMDLSEDEALQFLQMARANSYKQQDAPPALVRELIPPSLILAEDMDIAGQSVILALDENGAPEVIPETLKDGSPIDPGLKSLLGKVHFYPALEKGTPVASKIEFYLEQLFQ